MEKIMKWLEEKLAGPMQKFSANRFISAMTKSMFNVTPLLLIGAFAQMIGNVLFIFGIDIQLNMIYNLSTGLFSLLLAYAVADHLAEHWEAPRPITGLLSLAAFLLILRPELIPLDEMGMAFTFSIEMNRIGTYGMFVAIIVGLLVGEVVGQCIKRNITIRVNGLPDFISNFFLTIIPAAIVLVLTWVIAYVIDFDLYSTVLNLLAPLVSGSNTFAAWVLMNFLFGVLFVVGVNPACLFGIMFPIWITAIMENNAVAMAGGVPQNIATILTMMGWVVLGGTGATLPLNVIMLRSKSKILKSIGKAAIAPSIMNINEPLIFGIPIVFNPILGIPFVLCQTLNAAIAFIVMSVGLVTPPFNFAFITWCPVGLLGFLLNNDWRGIILTAALLVLDFLIWYPFFKVHERNVLKEEAEMEAAGEVLE